MNSPEPAPKTPSARRWPWRALGPIGLGGLAWAFLPPPLAMFGASTVPETLLIVAFLIISLALHEVGHAWVAWKRGDSTARDLGRLSLNPIVHIDPFMTIILPTILALTGGFIFGGAKPVPVNPMRLKSPLRDMMLVAIAGPLVNVLLAFVFFFARNTALANGFPADTLLIRVLEISGLLNVVLAVFNMLPIPPLDGSRVMTWLLPPQLRQSYVQLERFGLILVILAVFFVPPVQRAMWFAIDGISSWINELTYFA